jgi:penicillin amidase
MAISDGPGDLEASRHTTGAGVVVPALPGTQKKRLAPRAFAVVIGVLVLGLGAAGIWVRKQLHASLPVLSGTMVVAGPRAEIRIDRDSLGIPTIHARERDDVAFGLGFVHAQDRFFQMDGIRRSAAGELAEIIGAGGDDLVLKLDREARVFRFRAVARRAVSELSETDRRWLDAYVAGVNAGLKSLGARPFEYLLLGVEPAPWTAEDSVLAILAMFRNLQGKDFHRESTLGVVRDVLPGPLAAFLSPKGSREWDTPLVGGPLAAPPIPGPEVFDLRNEPPPSAEHALDPTPLEDLEVLFAASNNWAVSARRSATGAAIVANDMHLGLSVPNTWYRASWAVPETESRTSSEKPGPMRVTGATLPGGPAMVIGSNGRIAWGLTNSGGDWSDLIELTMDPRDPERYLTRAGGLPFEHHIETIKVKGRPDQQLDVRTTIWGPVIDRDHASHPRALRWVALEPGGVNLELIRLAGLTTAEQALRLAPTCGVPHLNLVVADDQGRIGWAIMGRIPRRTGQGDSRFPLDGQTSAGSWQGFYPPEESPRIFNPDTEILWTANTRVADGRMLEQIGFGDYDRGCRAGMIRDRLGRLDRATIADMLAIQLDDRAVFHDRWRGLFVNLLTPEAARADPRRSELRSILENWTGHASIDSAAYRLIWELRLRTVRAVLSPLTSRCRAADPEFRLAGLDCEAPAWALVSRRPIHLLDPEYPDWNSLLLGVVDETIAAAAEAGERLPDRTWGRKNVARIGHPIGRASPLIARLLDLNMPEEPLPGGRKDMPRIQGPTYGASQRMVVSPGREQEGIFHMPCGQSGHPLSPHYRDGHEAWSAGRPTPLLPGATVNTLILRPAGPA